MLRDQDEDELLGPLQATRPNAANTTAATSEKTFIGLYLRVGRRILADSDRTNNILIRGRGVNSRFARVQMQRQRLAGRPGGRATRRMQR